MKSKSYEAIIIELKRIQAANSRWGQRIGQALEDTETARKDPILTELSKLTGRVKTDYADMSFEELEKALDIARAARENAERGEKRGNQGYQ